jgi:hypothetical protein
MPKRCPVKVAGFDPHGAMTCQLVLPLVPVVVMAGRNFCAGSPGANWKPPDTMR